MEKSKIIDVKKNPFIEYGDERELSSLRPCSTVTELWRFCVEKYADALAIDDDKQYTYAGLDGDVAAFRGVLSESGIKKGDRVGVFMPNSCAFIKAFLAITTLGGVAVLLPPQLDDKTVFGCAHKFSLKAVVYDVCMTDKLALLPPTVQKIDVSRSASPVAAIDTDGKDGCAILFTGGTTGRSKGALLSNRAIMRGTKNGCYGYKGILGERYMLVLPLTHVFGLVRNMLTALYTGSAVHICRNPKNMFREMGAFHPTVLILVPALAELGINLSKQMGTGIFGGSLRHIIAGASAVAPHLIREYDGIGVTLLAGYGLTESANLVSGNPKSLEKPESVGLPYPEQQLKVVDGELWIRGEHVMDEYVGEPEENKAAFEDGWFKTGDLVRFDDEGYLYIVGRIKEVIVLDSGEKVSPSEVENKFCAPDYINDAMVYAEVTDGGRSILTLEVVVRPGFTVSKDEVKAEMDKINATLPTYMRVSKVIVRDEDFPRSPSMKKLRNK